jgi:polycomb protein EED
MSSTPGTKPKTSCNFRLKDIKIEDLKESRFYSVRFCEFHPSLWSHFAAAGSTILSIYKVEDTEIKLVRHYVDSDIGTEKKDENLENYYTCTWGTVAPNQPAVAVAGRRGVIKVINLVTNEMGALLGHGGEIHELQTHVNDNGLIFSASKDFSIRLWNIRTLVCIAVFGGEGGHRGEVISLDIHALGNCFVSCSMDTSIKIWNLKDPVLLHAIDSSDKFTALSESGKSISFKPVFLQIPLFSTNRMHSGYVDSVKWVGDCILSKSTQNRIVLWTPDTLRYKDATMILQEYTMHHGHVWFVKMSVCLPLGIFAVGSSKGRVYIFPLGPEIPENLLRDCERGEDTVERYQFEKSCHPMTNLQHAKTALVRETSFSADCSHLVYCTDEGAVQVWEIQIQDQEVEIVG